jgi:hypothetical protein
MSDSENSMGSCFGFANMSSEDFMGHDHDPDNMEEDVDDQLPDLPDMQGDEVEPESSSVGHKDPDLEVDEDECGWPDEQTAHLIELWKERSYMYDVSHNLYYKKTKKEGGYEEIAKALNCSGKCYVY